MILLVYAVISPLTSLVTAFCFLFAESVCRHQATFIYPTIPDSGGKIWMRFISVLLACLLIAEFTSTFRFELA
jgi:Calcium-dependent channel, 7TM region, putative phosphate